METLAEEVATGFSTVCVKLRELKPKIEQIRSHFQENKRGSVTLSGCRSFREFCENRLHRTEQAVYRLLSSDSKKSQRKTRVPKVPTAHQKPTFADEDIERLRSACFAAARYFDAEDSGEKMEAAKAKAEFLAIKNAGFMKPLISRTVPNYRSMLMGLLTEICKQDEKLLLPTPLMRSVAAMRKQLGVDEESFGILAKQDPPPSAAAQHSDRPMAGPLGVPHRRSDANSGVKMADGSRGPFSTLIWQSRGNRCLCAVAEKRGYA
jgi:hypothetical protein